MSWKFGNLGGKADPKSAQQPNANINEQPQVPSGYASDSTLQRVEKAVREFETLKSIVQGIGLGIAVFYTAKHSVRFIKSRIRKPSMVRSASRFDISEVCRFIESRICKPSLVQETSRLNINDMLDHPLKTAKRFLFRPQSDALKDVVLKPELEKQLHNLSMLTKNYNGFYAVLFYGQPGTGKTLAAKKLVTTSGVDYAILTGFKVAWLGAKAATEIDKLLDWASTSRRGLLVFIDSADAFLRERNTLEADLRPCVDAFLYHTDELDKNFMIILISGRPDGLDRAVNYRINQYIKFELPGPKERVRLLQLHFKKSIVEPAAQKRLKVDNFDYDATMSRISEMIPGFSGRQIMLLTKQWESAASASSKGVLTEEIMLRIVEQRLKERSAPVIQLERQQPGGLPKESESNFDRKGIN